MARFYGKVGFATIKEDPENPGVWIDSIREGDYFGDVLQNRSRWSQGTGANDDLSIENRISIVADPYACQNFSKIKYVKWMHQAWKVTAVEVERPRLILTIGEEWNGEQTATPECSGNNYWF